MRPTLTPSQQFAEERAMRRRGTRGFVERATTRTPIADGEDGDELIVRQGAVLVYVRSSGADNREFNRFCRKHDLTPELAFEAPMCFTGADFDNRHGWIISAPANILRQLVRCWWCHSYHLPGAARDMGRGTGGGEITPTLRNKLRQRERDERLPSTKTDSLTYDLMHMSQDVLLAWFARKEFELKERFRIADGDEAIVIKRELNRLEKLFKKVCE